MKGEQRSRQSPPKKNNGGLKMIKRVKLTGPME
jgi:hypothetical protein